MTAAKPPGWGRGCDEELPPPLMPDHFGIAPCWEQPGRQRWHLRCALRHPFVFLRTRSVIGL